MTSPLNSLSQTVVVRKALALGGSIPRAARRIVGGEGAYRAHPPLLANSFPKSGTHLLLQILRGLPGVHYYHGFLASQPSRPFFERNHQAHMRHLRDIAPGEVLPGHLFYATEFNEELQRIRCIHFFIYRDPRDVVVSEAHYLTRMNRWHALHPYFVTRAGTMEARILMSIRGISEPEFPYEYPDVSARFARYRPWLSTPGIITLRFEDLVSDGLEHSLHRIAATYAQRSGCGLDVKGVVHRMRASIDPSKSLTFRQGRAGAWQTAFTAQHKTAMKALAGQLLIDLGYERDFDW